MSRKFWETHSYLKKINVNKLFLFPSWIWVREYMESFRTKLKILFIGMWCMCSTGYVSFWSVTDVEFKWSVGNVWDESSLQHLELTNSTARNKNKFYNEMLGNLARYFTILIFFRRNFLDFWSTNQPTAR